MQIDKIIDGTIARLSLEGRFDFHSHREFRMAYESVLADKKITEVEVDFEKVDYLDSSALGMLLLLREKGEASKKIISLINITGSVKQVLEIANFGKLFKIR